MEVSSSFGSTVANVVLPRPGGPSERMWAIGSLSFLLALSAIRSRSTTEFCPKTSVSLRGRNASSRCLSSLGGAAVSVPLTIASRAMKGNLALFLQKRSKFSQDESHGKRFSPSDRVHGPLGFDEARGV